MMRNVVLVVVLLAVALVSSGCVAGPYICENTVQDWSANVYADNAYLGTMNYVLVHPIGMAIASVGDLVFVNTYHWWWFDVWDGKGQTYDHAGAPNGRTNNNK